MGNMELQKFYLFIFYESIDIQDLDIVGYMKIPTNLAKDIDILDYIDENLIDEIGYQQCFRYYVYENGSYSLHNVPISPTILRWVIELPTSEG